MKNKTLTILFIILLSITFTYAFSASYSTHNIDNIAYVIAIGIDTADIDNYLKISFEFIDISSFSEQSSANSTEPIIEEVSAPSISSGIDIMNAYLGKQINLSHCKIVVFSEDVAKKGILSEISEFSNDKQARASANIVIAKESARKYLENSMSSLEKTITKYYDIFTQSTIYTGYTSNIILGNIYESLLTEESGAIAIYGNILQSSNSNQSNNSESTKGSSSNSTGSSNSSSSESNSSNSSEYSNASSNPDQISSENYISSSSLENSLKGDKGTLNTGLAVFRDQKFIDTLSSEEALCRSILSNDVDNFFISISSPFNSNDLIDLSISIRRNTKIKVDTSTDSPIIYIDIFIDSKISNILNNVDYTSDDTLNAISNEVSIRINEQISKYLNRCAKELDVDLNNFYRFAKRNFLTNDDWNNYDWKNKFKNSTFNINIQNEIIPNLIISRNVP